MYFLLHCNLPGHSSSNCYRLIIYLIYCIIEIFIEIHHWWVWSSSMCFFGRWIRLWHPLFSYSSRFGCTGSRIFALKKKQKWAATIFWMYFNAFMDKESEKISEWTMNLPLLFFDISRDFHFQVKCFIVKTKNDKN